MKKRNKKITFVFQTGRKKKLKSNEKFAKDMFYTYFNFSEEFETEIIEFRNFKHTPINKFFLIFEREVIRRFFKIPAYWVFLTSKEMINKHYDKLIDMAKNESSPYEKKLHEIYEEELCFSPIPSLSIHCTNANSVFGLSPNVNIKKLWEDFK